MKENAQYSAQLNPRNYRILYLIDRNVPFDFLKELVMKNYRMWGGRLNPFIPVNNNQIDADYLDLCKELDPDLIYYTAGCDKDELLAQLTFLHPYDCIELPTDRGTNMPGLYSGYLITNDLLTGVSFNRELTLMHLQPGTTGQLASFYELSYGLGPLYVEDKTFAANYKAVTVSASDIAELPVNLRVEKPFPTCLLSEEKCLNTIFRATNDWQANQLEVIVYAEENAFDDIIYFWNRRLFQTSRRQLKQIIISQNQLTEIIKNEHFEAYLYESFFTSNFQINSKTIGEEQLSEICKTINTNLKRIHFQVATDSQFPYEFHQSNLSTDPRDTSFKLMLKSSTDYIAIPPPFPNLSIHGIRADYALDFIMTAQESLKTNYIKFPFFTQVHHLVSPQKSRINRWHNLSFFVKANDDKGFNVRVPTQEEIIRTRILERCVLKDGIKIPVGYPRVSTAGMKLRSFVELFNEEWYTIDSFTGDSFYIRLCLRISLFRKSVNHEMKRTAGESIERFHKKIPESNIKSTIDSFNQLDLKNELEHYYYRYKEKLRKMFRGEGLEISDDELIAFISRSIEEDFNTHINIELQELVERQALYMGMRVKCNNCGSNYWYSLKQLDNVMACQGCHRQVSPSVTAPIAYKFNSVVVNNLRANVGLTKETFDGNYIVLRTLIYLATQQTRVHQSFLYSPSLDIEMMDGEKKTATDLDILAVVNGELIIGEAKPNATDFNKKQMEQLIWVGKNIKPDKVILAYLDGAIEAKVQAISAAINDPAVAVVSYKVPAHWHRFGRIFGCSEVEEQAEPEIQ